MKTAQIIHNPGAGDTRHNKEELLNLVKKAGYNPEYVSTADDNWEKFYKNEFAVIIVAGGDGSIRKLAGVLLHQKMINRHIPIRLLPIGTANNIALTLNASNDDDSLKLEGSTGKFDCGMIEGINQHDFFLESVGMGIFPDLISEMKKNKMDDVNPSQKLKFTLGILLQIIGSFKAQKAKIQTDGITITGSFLMVELMNIKSIGPNLMIAPGTDPGDGYFDLVMIPEKRRAELENYVSALINEDAGEADLSRFVTTLRVKKVKMKWYGPTLHVDDNLVSDYSGKSFNVKIIPGALEFLENN